MGEWRIPISAVVVVMVLWQTSGFSRNEEWNGMEGSKFNFMI